MFFIIGIFYIQTIYGILKFFWLTLNQSKIPVVALVHIL